MTKEPNSNINNNNNNYNNAPSSNNIMHAQHGFNNMMNTTIYQPQQTQTWPGPPGLQNYPYTYTPVGLKKAYATPPTHTIDVAAAAAPAKSPSFPISTIPIATITGTTTIGNNPSTTPPSIPCQVQVVNNKWNSFAIHNTKDANGGNHTAIVRYTCSSSLVPINLYNIYEIYNNNI